MGFIIHFPHMLGTVPLLNNTCKKREITASLFDTAIGILPTPMALPR